jgi:hypothetical protein
MNNSNQYNTIQYKLQKYRNLSNNNPNNNTYTYKLQKYQSLLQSQQSQQSQKGGILNAPNRTDIQTEQLIGKIKNMLKNDSSSLTGGNNNSYTGYRNMQYGGEGPQRVLNLDELLKEARAIIETNVNDSEAIINCDDITEIINKIKDKINKMKATTKDNQENREKLETYKNVLSQLIEKYNKVVLTKQNNNKNYEECIKKIRKEVETLLNELNNEKKD